MDNTPRPDIIPYSGKHASKYFSRVFTKDILEKNETTGNESKEEYLRKKQNQLEELRIRIVRLEQIRAAVRHPGFVILEQLALDRLEVIEQEDIWKAIEKRDFVEANQLAGMRHEIQKLFLSYDDIEDRILAKKDEINQLVQEIEITDNVNQHLGESDDKGE